MVLIEYQSEIFDYDVLCGSSQASCVPFLIGVLDMSFDLNNDIIDGMFNKIIQVN